MRIADVLVRKGLITTDQLEEALRVQRAQGLRFDAALLRLGFIDERPLLDALGEHLGLEVVNLAGTEIERDVLRALPPKLVYRNRLLPIARQEDMLVVATADAFDMNVFDDLRLLSGEQIRPVLASRVEIEKLIKAHFGVGGDTIDEMVGTDAVELKEGESGEDLMEMAQEASVIKLVNEIIVEAVNERASDIHVEPYENRLSIRYRIDGVLHQASLPEKIHRFQAAIISRIKILANLNIAERRLPQDGRIEFNVGGRQIDVRVSVIPMLFGEGVVMRLLDKANVLFTLQELGMDAETFGSFESLIQRPHGIILVTGPTGSGKTTTLYAALNAIVSNEIKVLTVEDPVEYYLQGVNQIPVDSRVGMTFERGLRSILRHDPDVVMIGEIRDLETAHAATQAALTGHLVLSTLHTNDAASAPMRLIDMGVEPYLVSSTMIASMAQRLVRRICKKCGEAYDPSKRKLPADFGWQDGERLHRGVGCEFCRNTGYRGRTGLYELMLVDDGIRERIMRRAPATEVLNAALKGGLRLLRQDGWLKVRRGDTTIDEVITVTAI